jgi:serine/threonine protein phosphatase PrpC
VILGTSIGELPEKKNWDCWTCVNLPLEGKELSLLVVCDGVSSSPQGGEAAALACRTIEKRAGGFVSEEGTLNASLSGLVRHVHSTVRDTFGGEGICCLVAVIIDPTSSEFALANVGDSPGYLYWGGRMEELTQLHRVVRAKRLNNENVIIAGMPILEKGLTQAIGQMGNVNLHCVL